MTIVQCERAATAVAGFLPRAQMRRAKLAMSSQLKSSERRRVKDRELFALRITARLAQAQFRPNTGLIAKGCGEISPLIKSAQTLRRR